MPDGGEHEAFLTADYNAEMIEHIARYPRIRDRAIFVGERRRRRPGPLRRRAAADPRLDRAALRLRRLRDRLRPGGARATASGCAPSSGSAPTSRSASSPSAARASASACCAASIEAFPEAKRRVPDLRMIVVAGPRIDPASLPGARRARGPRRTSTTCTAYLAACDLAVVQGGLTTAMELTASRQAVPVLPARATTSSRTSTSATGSSATAPAVRWTSRPTGRRRSQPRSRRRSAARSTTAPVDPGGAARAAASIAELL